MWVKLDDQFADHPKLTRAGPLAGWLYVCGLCYAARYKTDGFIPAGQLRRLADFSEWEPDGVEAICFKLASRLVEANLWEPASGGYQIHDYLAYNPSREEAARLSQVRAEVGRRGGVESGKARRSAGNAITEPAPAPKQIASDLVEANAKQNGSKREAVPVPSNTPNGVTPTPYGLLEALCEELGVAPSELGERDRNRQLAVGKRLVTDGVTTEELRRVIGWLSAQTWVEGGIDLFLVEKQMAKWRMAGRPDKPSKRKATTYRDPRANKVAY